MTRQVFITAAEARRVLSHNESASLIRPLQLVILKLGVLNFHNLCSWFHPGITILDDAYFSFKKIIVSDLMKTWTPNLTWNRCTRRDLSLIARCVGIDLQEKMILPFTSSECFLDFEDPWGDEKCVASCAFVGIEASNPLLKSQELASPGRSELSQEAFTEL